MSDETTRRLPGEGELRARSTDEQFRVTQHKETERPFTGRYLHNKEKGVYSCVACGAELFASETKYDSGSGWPSFWLPTCATHGAHLGHVFDDGPQPTGLRYCVNSASLDFKLEDDAK